MHPRLTGVPILTIDAAGAVAGVGLWSDLVLSSRHDPGGHGQAGRLAALVAELLDGAGIEPGSLVAVAVTVGPGSFTGLRAAISLAHGIAMAAGVALIPVTVAEALRAALPHLGHRALWVALDSRRARVFLDGGDGPAPYDLATLPVPSGPVAVAGDAAVAVAARWAVAGVDVMLSDARHPRPQDIARAALARRAGVLPALAPVPLYVDPPEARPATGLRPAPLPRPAP